MNTLPQNRFKCIFPARSVNESFARMAASAFVAQLDPRVDELADLKTAVSEAVTNVIVHAYAGTEIPPDRPGRPLSAVANGLPAAYSGLQIGSIG